METIEFQLVVDDTVVRRLRDLICAMGPSEYVPTEQLELIRRFVQDTRLTLNPHTHNATLWTEGR